MTEIAPITERLPRAHRWPATLVGLLLAALVPEVAGADVAAYYTQTTLSGETRLVGVTVDRKEGGVTFDAGRLIGVRLTHFRSTADNNLIAVPGAVPPAGAQRGTLLSDGLLNTGIINPGGQAKALTTDPVLAGPDATPGMAVAFVVPVVNRPGDDVVLFEFHRALGSPPGGDAFHVSPLKFAPGLRSLTVRAFDFDVDDPRALPQRAFALYRLPRPPRSLEELENAPLTGAGTPDDFKILAVGIDLSDLGYADGAKVSGLFFQDCDGLGLLLDPVLIAGLPAPDAENLLDGIPKTASSVPQPGDLLRAMLEGPLAGVDEIVFAERVCGFDHWYANFGFYSASVPEYPPQRGIPDENIPRCFGDGGRLCRLNLRTGERTVLLDDPQGGVRDPQVGYDGRAILFSYRKGGQPYYHLYEIGIDGSALRQLTDGPYDDIEPIRLPDGGIVFCSSRCKRFVNCYRTPVATLYRCDADGGNIRPISTNIEHDNTPWLLGDGRLLYMRWEYVDRSQFSFHHLWTINPDGTGQMVFYGNQFDGTAMLDAKPIPGTDRVVASFSPGHGVPGHMGHVTIVDPSTGPDDRGAARRVSRGPLFRDPYPLSEGCFLVADNRGIWVMDGQGNTDLVYKPDGGDGLTYHEPRPLRSRPREPVIPSRVEAARATGRFYLGDVYHGRNMAGVKRGEVTKLLVLEQLPKPTSFSGGMWPISVGGTFTLARVLGTVPVEPDGSAYFEVPAMRPVFFVALDENDLGVKRMQSFTSVMPGETTGCVGCHEPRMQPPLARTGIEAFLGRKPRAVEPIADVPDVLDFPRDIQPILDRHCLRCHNPDKREGGVDLCGDHSPLFSQSYWAIMHGGLIADGRNERYGDRAPRTIGSSASKLLEYLDGGHYDVSPTVAERKTVRLWIESSAPYAGTYAALGSGMHPVEFPIDAMEKRCGACHGREPEGKPIGKGMVFRFGEKGPYLPLVHRFTDLQQIRGSIGYYKFGDARPPQSLCNLTRPDKSLLLRAPLVREAGGLGLCEPPVFSTTQDADYQTMLAPIRDAAAHHAVEKRFDMPGFRPNVYYLRTMQRYGVLPAAMTDETPIDFYAADEAYWRSFWHRPAR